MNYSNEKLVRILKEDPILILQDDIRNKIIKQLEKKPKGIEEYQHDLRLLNRKIVKLKKHIEHLITIIKIYKKRYNIDDNELLISELYSNMSTRLYNCLMREGLTTLEKVLQCIDKNNGEIKIRNMGENTAKELYKLLEEYKIYKEIN